MSQSVIIKSSKNGINLVLDPELPYTDLLDEIRKKFKDSEKFFAHASFALSFEGRELSDAEKNQIVDAIMSDTTIKILCIVENDEIRDAILQQKIEEQERSKEAAPGKKAKGCFYYGSLAPGEHLETDESVVIIGGVPSQAVVVSKGNIVVLGPLLGSAFAGMDGRTDAFITALSFLPEQYNIAGVYGAPVLQEKSSVFSKRNKTPQAKQAFLCDGIINIRPVF